MIDETLASIAAVEGVAGVVAFSASGAPLGAQPAGIFDAEALGRVGRHLSELAEDLEQLHPLGVRALNLEFRDARLLLQPFRTGTLGVIVAPGCNPSLVQLRLRLATRALDAEVAPPHPARERAPAAPDAGAPRERLAAIVREQLGDKASRALGLLEAAGENPAALAAAIGQIGRFTRLFISSEQAGALERALVEALAGPSESPVRTPSHRT